jgi:hypothetical protein
MFTEGATVEQLVEGIEKGVPTVRDFTRLAEATAGMNDGDGARAIAKAFDRIFEHYDNPPGYSGPYYRTDFDFWKFIGHELYVTLVATLLREERYEVLGDVMSEEITITNSGGRSKAVGFEHASKYLESFREITKAKNSPSYHADLLHARHANGGPLADSLPFDDFVGADYFLFLRGELPPEQKPDTLFLWTPWISSAYMRNAPRFIQNASRATTATRLATALGLADVNTLRTRLLERSGRLARLWREPGFEQPVHTEDIERIGTR